MGFTAIPREKFIFDRAIEFERMNRAVSPDMVTMHDPGDEVRCDVCGSIVKEEVLWVKNQVLFCARCRQPSREVSV